MVHKIHASLPYTLISYIFNLAKILYIQYVWRNNRPRKVCYYNRVEWNGSKQVTRKIKWRTRSEPYCGDRVLLVWKQSPITGIKQRKIYGTVDKIGETRNENFYCRIRLVSHFLVPKTVFYHAKALSVWSPTKIIILEPWKSEQFLFHQVNGLFGYFPD